MEKISKTDTYGTSISISRMATEEKADPDITLTPFAYRLLNEYNELQERIFTLESFLDDESDRNAVVLSKKQSRLLQTQLDAMSTYSDILRLRIDDLGIDYHKINKYL